MYVHTSWTWYVKLHSDAGMFLHLGGVTPVIVVVPRTAATMPISVTAAATVATASAVPRRVAGVVQAAMTQRLVDGACGV